MVDKQIVVDLLPQVRVTWPDGRSMVFSQQDLAQLVYTLLIEGLLILKDDARGRVLKEMELDLVNGPDGELMLQPSALAGEVG